MRGRLAPRASLRRVSQVRSLGVVGSHGVGLREGRKRIRGDIKSEDSARAFFQGEEVVIDFVAALAQELGVLVGYEDGVERIYIRGIFVQIFSQDRKLNRLRHYCFFAAQGCAPYYVLDAQVRRLSIDDFPEDFVVLGDT